MRQALDQEVLGVLGGMGPLASAAFVQTIYSAFRGRMEHEAPTVLLYSNPKVPDPTTVFLSGGDHRMIFDELVAGLRGLVGQGATQLVICSLTAHYFLSELPPDLREKVVSLIDVILEEVQQQQRPGFLACTSGTLRLGLFQQHPSWKAVEHLISLPDEKELALLHDAIYSLKRTHAVGHLIHVLLSICEDHQVDAIIAGCAELHLLSKDWAGPNALNQKIHIIDPLATIALQFSEEFCLAQI